MDLIDFQKRLRSIDIGKMIDRAVLEEKEQILDSNTAQLSKGKDSLGNFLDEYASEAYAQFKIAWGSQAPLGIPDLKLEGDFYEGFTLISEGEGEFRITSDDSKTQRLKDKYGVDIFGLSDENMSNLRNSILITVQNNLRNELLR